jgi:hypothetical protein
MRRSAHRARRSASPASCRPAQCARRRRARRRQVGARPCCPCGIRLGEGYAVRRAGFARRGDRHGGVTVPGRESSRQPAAPAIRRSLASASACFPAPLGVACAEQSLRPSQPTILRRVTPSAERRRASVCIGPQMLMVSHLARGAGRPASRAGPYGTGPPGPSPMMAAARGGAMFHTGPAPPMQVSAALRIRAPMGRGRRLPGRGSSYLRTAA